MKAKWHGVADCRARGEQGLELQGGEPPQSAAPRAWRAAAHARRVGARRHRRYPLTRGQDFLAGRVAGPGTMTRHRAGHWWTFHGPAAGLRLTRRFGAAPDVRVKYPCDQRIRWGESHSQMEGFQAEGGSTPYPHIALYAVVPRLISGPAAVPKLP